jgi:hypothetical protein
MTYLESLINLTRFLVGNFASGSAEHPIALESLATVDFQPF